jgi:hypothetical protein
MAGQDLAAAAAAEALQALPQIIVVRNKLQRRAVIGDGLAR